MNFQVGDRVRCIKGYMAGVDIGETGVVVGMNDGFVLVRWDLYKGHRHNCGGLCESGHGWNLPIDRVEHEVLVADLGELPILDITSIL